MIIRTNRAKPRLQILRGWDLVNTATLNQVHPVADATIKSGQVIYRDWENNRYVWKKGCVAGKAPYIAFQDATEADVIAADGLTGISISGDYELQTGYFSSGTYNADTLLTFDGTSGNVKPAAEGELVIGRVTRIRGAKQLNSGSITEVPVNSETLAGANSAVITFETSNMGYLQEVDAIATTTPVPG